MLSMQWLGSGDGKACLKSPAVRAASPVFRRIANIVIFCTSPLTLDHFYKHHSSKHVEEHTPQQRRVVKGCLI
jgi:hypothetical protein